MSTPTEPHEESAEWLEAAAEYLAPLIDAADDEHMFPREVREDMAAAYRDAAQRRRAMSAMLDRTEPYPSPTIHTRPGGIMLSSMYRTTELKALEAYAEVTRRHEAYLDGVQRFVDDVAKHTRLDPASLAIFAESDRLVGVGFDARWTGKQPKKINAPKGWRWDEAAKVVRPDMSTPTGRGLKRQFDDNPPVFYQALEELLGIPRVVAMPGYSGKPDFYVRADAIYAGFKSDPGRLPAGIIGPGSTDITWERLGMLEWASVVELDNLKRATVDALDSIGTVR